MTFELDRSSKEPVYSQIADWLEAQFEAGVLREDERLPAERKLCAQTGVARNTAKRAYQELVRRGRASLETNGGCYIRSRDSILAQQEAEKIAQNAVLRLREFGLSKSETEHLFLRYIWARLPEKEKIKVAWVDCSMEILHDIALKIEGACNVSVKSFLEDDILEDASPLLEGGFDLIATTVNHYDEILPAIERAAGADTYPEIGMVVLAISSESVGHLARIKAGMHVVVVYDTELYRYSIERYLEEFAVKGKIEYVQMQEVSGVLADGGQSHVVILPQDFSYGGGQIQAVYHLCRGRGIPCFAMQQKMDNGSLLHLKKQIQQKWMKVPFRT